LDFANTKTLDPRITFTRASTGTYYDGKTVAKAEENLLIRSQQFDFFTAGNTTVISNLTAAPDGTTTADTVTENTSTSGHEIYQSFTSTTGLPYTWSVFVKANGRTKVRFRCQATAVIYDVNYDLTAVTTTNISGTGTATITDAGNGWYRITATTTSTASGTGYWQFNLLDGSSNISYTGDGTSGVFLWGAQLEQRSSVTAYTATTTAPITNYIPALQTAASGVARFEHNPITGESLGLEIEEQRTNIVLQSQFASGWTISASSISANAIVAPDGTLTGAKIVENTSAGTHGVYQALTLVTSSVYTWSVYVKYAGRQWFAMVPQSVGFSASQYYDIQNGVIGTATAGITATITSIGNGWYRCTATATSSGSSGFINTWASNADGSASYTGNGFDGYYIWGAQVELGAFATSYIPTVASQVTRSADAASMTGTNFSSWYRADEGTLYAEGLSAIGNSASANQMIASIGDGAVAQNQVTMYRSGVAILVQLTQSGGTTVSNLSSGLTATNSTNYKFVTGYKVNDFTYSVNANTVQTDTLGAVPVNVNKLDIGNWHVSVSGNWNSTIKKVAYYAKRLTNAELVSLTTV
jgi:hypothetical protein